MMLKRKAINPGPQDDELDHEINNLEAIHQQVEKRREKTLRLSELQKMDKATKEMCNIKSHEKQYNYKDLRHEGHNFGHLCLETYNFQDFLYDEAFPLQRNCNPHIAHHYTHTLHCPCTTSRFVR
jgi:hypothetical protein